MIAGRDFQKRRQVLDKLRLKLLGENQTGMSVQVFYPDDLDPGRLRENLLNFSFEQRRLAVFKDFCRLDPEVRGFLSANFEKIIQMNFVIFETELPYASLQEDKKIYKDDFFSLVLKKAYLLKIHSPQMDADLEDFKRSLRRRDVDALLVILNKLLATPADVAALGPQIMGILVAEFSYADRANKEKYLQYLWEADRRVKENGVSAKLAIELFIAQVFCPQRGLTAG